MSDDADDAAKDDLGDLLARVLECDDPLVAEWAGGLLGGEYGQSERRPEPKGDA